MLLKVYIPGPNQRYECAYGIHTVDLDLDNNVILPNLFLNLL